MGRTSLAIIVVAVIAVAVIASYYFLLAPQEKRGEERIPEPVKQFMPSSATSFNIRVEGVAKPGQKIPLEYTCDSPTQRTPVITWEKVEKAKSYAVIVVDPDAPMGAFYHLVVYNIPASDTKWPLHGTLGVNSAGRKSWFPACPPPGHGAHRYFFIVLALDTPPELPPGLSGQQLAEHVKTHIIGYGYTYAVYRR